MRCVRFQAVLAGALALFGLGLLGCTAPDTATGTTSPAAPTGTRPVGTPTTPGRTPVGPTRPPLPAHVVVVVEENHSPGKIIGAAPYLTSLAQAGANFTNAYAIGHPSQPNYLALFAGLTYGLTSDSCPHTFTDANLGSEMIGSGYGFAGYSEGLPSDGYQGCTAGRYARKHNPWVNFSNIPAESNLMFSQFPQGDFTALPRLSFVIPNLCDDMHDCDVATGDAWLQRNIGGYATWALTNNSLLIVTFDEAEKGVANRVPLIFYGQPVTAGTYPERVDHYSVLRTLEDIYGLACTANACTAKPITDAWK